MKKGRGGRREKSEEDQLSQTVKTTLTKADLDQLQQHYRQHNVGQKISFAEYVRQLLLARTAQTNGPNERSALLSIQLELDEVSKSMAPILDELKQKDRLYSMSNQSVDVLRDAHETDSLQTRLSQNIDRIEATVKQISQWLYDCSPEKI